MNLSLPLALLLASTAVSAVSAQTVRGAVLANHEPHHHVAYADAEMRVLRVRVPAHDTTLLHEHIPDYFWIALGASEIVSAKPGSPDATVKSADLTIHYAPGKFAHVARNPTTIPFDNITVELLKPQGTVKNLCVDAMANAPKACPGSDPREVPAFETNRLRVDLVTIEPGAVMRVGAAAPRWIIALDTNDTKGSLKLSRGSWVGGVFRAASNGWVLTNQAKKPIRVLSVVNRAE